MALIDDLRSSIGTAYSIDRELGGGGMSRVFVGEETALGRKVVVKVLAPERAAGVSAERFNREIKLAAKLQHPNIVPVLAAGIAAGLPYYTMPFVDGLSLRARLERNSSVPIAEAIAVLKDVARALAYAHDHGVVHRDIKPENVLLADEAAVVTDFGIAKALSVARAEADGTLTREGTSLGTPAYMAPEQIAADPNVDHRADIYSFGCVAYELLTGASPFAAKLPQQLLAAHIMQTPDRVEDRRPDCPSATAALVMKCLEKDSAARPQTAREILRALEASTSTDHTVHRAPDARHSYGKRMVFAAIAGVAIVSAIGAYVTRDRQPVDIHSLAVLPFENGGDTANAYFAEGMSDEITTELARVPGLKLASRNSVARYRSADPKQVGEALDVGGVISGTVRRAGDRLRLTAQLTEAASGKLLWTEAYEQRVQDVFAVQDSITMAIVAALKLKLGDTQLLASQSAGAGNVQGTNNLEAYDLYLRGRYLLQRRGTYLYQALDRFEEATRKDPTFARAYAGYAMAASVLPSYTDTPVDSITPIGLRFGRRAMQLDPNLADAYLGVGNMLQYNFEWDEVIRLFKRAIEIEPNNAAAHQWLGDIYWVIGRGGEAELEVRKAVQLEPASALMRQDLTAILFNRGKPDESALELAKSFELDSVFPYNKINKGILHYVRRQYDSVTAISGDPYPPYLSLFRMKAYAKLGNQRSMEHLRDSVIAELRKPGGDKDGSRRAVYFAALQNADSTFYYLDRVIDKRGALIFTAGIPCFGLFKFMHDDPRWKRTLDRMHAQACEGVTAIN